MLATLKHKSPKILSGQHLVQLTGAKPFKKSSLLYISLLKYIQVHPWRRTVGKYDQHTIFSTHDLEKI